MAFDFTSLIPVVGDLIGGFIGSSANDDAAKMAKKALDKQIKFQRESRDLAIARLNEAVAKAGEIYDPYMRQGAAGEQYLLETLGQPEGMMTEAQRIGLEDLTRQTRNNLAVSGLRGAGRAGQAVLADAQRRYTADAEAVNRARRDAAAAALHGTGFSAAAGRANAEMGTGSNVAQTITGAGNSIGNALAQIGQEQAAARIGSGNIWGETIGAISGAITDFAKRGRGSRYSGLDFVA